MRNVPKKKTKNVPEPVLLGWGVTGLERSQLIVQLRCEIASDSAKAFRTAATSNVTQLLRIETREILHAIAEGFELQARLLKSMLNLAKVKP